MFTVRNTLIAASLAALARAQSTPTNCDPTDPTTPEQICSIRAAFGGNQVPQIVPTFLPSGALYVHYDGIVLGGAQQLAPSRVSSAPGIQFNLTEGLTAGPQYVFMMVDPDAGENSQVLHYMLTDCQVNEETLYLEGCTAAAPYGGMLSPLVVLNQSDPNFPMGPAPPENSGLHRYIQLLYTQPEGFETPEFPETIQDSRLGFSYMDFVSENQLGDIQGGMYFRSEFDGSSTDATNTMDPNTVGGAAATGAASSASDEEDVASSTAAPSSSSARSANTSSNQAQAASATPSATPDSGAEKIGMGAGMLLAGAGLLALL